MRASKNVHLHVDSGGSGNCLLKDLAAVKETGTSVPEAANADLQTNQNIKTNPYFTVLNNNLEMHFNQTA